MMKFFMRYVCLIITSIAAGCTAPLTKQSAKSDLELTLSAQDQLQLGVSIQNNGKKPLRLPYHMTPFEHFVIVMHGEKGKGYPYKLGPGRNSESNAKTLMIPPGLSKTIYLDAWRLRSSVWHERRNVMSTMIVTLFYNMAACRSGQV